MPELLLTSPLPASCVEPCDPLSPTTEESYLEELRALLRQGQELSEPDAQLSHQIRHAVQRPMGFLSSTSRMALTPDSAPGTGLDADALEQLASGASLFRNTLHSRIASDEDATAPRPCSKAFIQGTAQQVRANLAKAEQNLLARLRPLNDNLQEQRNELRSRMKALADTIEARAWLLLQKHYGVEANTDVHSEDGRLMLVFDVKTHADHQTGDIHFVLEGRPRLKNGQLGLSLRYNDIVLGKPMMAKGLVVSEFRGALVGAPADSAANTLPRVFAVEGL